MAFRISFPHSIYLIPIHSASIGLAFTHRHRGIRATQSLPNQDPCLITPSSVPKRNKVPHREQSSTCFGSERGQKEREKDTQKEIDSKRKTEMWLGQLRPLRVCISLVPEHMPRVRPVRMVTTSQLNEDCHLFPSLHTPSLSHSIYLLYIYISLSHPVFSMTLCLPEGGR